LNFRPAPFAHNKLKFFQKFKANGSGFSGFIPRYFTPDNYSVVQNVLDSSVTATNHPLFVERHLLNGHSGDGIRLLKRGDIITPGCPLIVEYIPKKREFRVHFFKNHVSGQILYYIQEKKKRIGSATIPHEYQIRNHQNGWVYCTNGVAENIPSSVIHAFKLFAENPDNTLDFGAIDIIYNSQNETAWILEVNTAPGITGGTLNWYKNRIENLLMDADWI
jgi:hypothetical protein